MPHGTLFDEMKTTGYGMFHSETASEKQPVEGEYASATSPTGQISENNFSFNGTGETGPSEKKAKTTDPCSGQGAGASNNPPGVSSHKQCKGFGSPTQDASGYTDYDLGYGSAASSSSVPQQKMPANAAPKTSQGASGYTDDGLCGGSASFGSVPQQSMPGNTAFQTSQGAFGYADHGLGCGYNPFGSVPQQGMPHDPTPQLAMLQLLMQQLGPGPLSGLLGDQIPPSMFGGSYDAPAADSPSMPPRSYSKSGYLVVISNGTLCHSSEEKGVVEMESGSPFKIAIANNNDYGELIFKFDKMLMLAINFIGTVW